MNRWLPACLRRTFERRKHAAPRCRPSEAQQPRRPQRYLAANLSTTVLCVLGFLLFYGMERSMPPRKLEHMKHKYKHGKKTEAVPGRTSQGTSTPPQSPPQSVEAHNTPTIPPAVLGPSAPGGESPVKAKGVAGHSVVRSPQKKEDYQRLFAASSSELDRHAGSTRAGQGLISMPSQERHMTGEVVEALRGIDLNALPSGPTGEAIRGLVWALEYAVSPKTKPRHQHDVPCHLRLSKEDEALGQAAIDEVWKSCASLLYGLTFFQPYGHVDHRGVDWPACWSPGDFYQALEDARDVLVRLETLNDKLYNLQCGRLAKHTDTED